MVTLQDSVPGLLNLLLIIICNNSSSLNKIHLKHAGGLDYSISIDFLLFYSFVFFLCNGNCLESTFRALSEGGLSANSSNFIQQTRL